MGSVENYIGHLEELSHNYMLVIICFSIVLVFPLCGPLIKCVKGKESRILDLFFEKEANQDYRKVSTEQGLFCFMLYSKGVVYSGAGFLVSGIWTNQWVALLGGSTVISGILSLFVLNRFCLNDVPSDQNGKIRGRKS